MANRFITIWFRFLRTDWFSLRQPALRTGPFVLSVPDHGRLVVSAANLEAQAHGILPGIPVADARAIITGLPVLDDKPGLSLKLLKGLGEWLIRFTPIVATDEDGLILDVSGCTHLWGGDRPYLTEIIKRLSGFGYHVQAAMADTIGASWALAHFSHDQPVIETGKQTEALLYLPPAALRLEADTITRLEKLGLRQVRQFIAMPRNALRRRFGPHFIMRMNQALGLEQEFIEPVCPVVPYQERLPCLEPIVTATGISIALTRLMEALCKRLAAEMMGLRIAIFTCYRLDGKLEKVEIGTNRPSHHAKHLLKLFEDKLASIEPDLGIELFTLEGRRVEPAIPVQSIIWSGARGLGDTGLSELLDRMIGKFGANKVHRFVPDEHYWPERSIKSTIDLQEPVMSAWRTDRQRPLQLLPRPELIEVTAPIPDYPPMMFRLRGKLHKIIRADGPERIEQEWWLQNGQHRDYYAVEDEDGHRYWLFRSGHYNAERNYQWFIHGYFA